MESIAETGKDAPRPYSSSSGAGSWVVLRHQAAAAACACLAVDAAAAYCTSVDAVQIRPADGFLYNHCPNSRGFYKSFFSDIVFYNLGLPEKLTPFC